MLSPAVNVPDPPFRSPCHSAVPVAGMLLPPDVALVLRRRPGEEWSRAASRLSAPSDDPGRRQPVPSTLMAITRTAMAPITTTQTVATTRNIGPFTAGP